MERSSIIAVVGTVAGVMVAGSVASVAVINAAAAGTTKPETVSLTALQQGQELLDLPAVGADPMGIDIPAIDIPAASATASTVASSQAANQSMTTLTTSQGISAKAARSAVRQATGGSVISTSLGKHQGFDAYAVKVTRPDGSVVTGHVDSKTGVIFSWVVNKEAPAPVATYADDDEDEYDDEGSEHEEDEDEHEEEDHDNDDD